MMADIKWIRTCFEIKKNYCFHLRIFFHIFPNWIRILFFFQWGSVSKVSNVNDRGLRATSLQSSLAHTHKHKYAFDLTFAGRCSFFLSVCVHTPLNHLESLFLSILCFHWIAGYFIWTELVECVRVLISVKKIRAKLYGIELLKL